MELIEDPLLILAIGRTPKTINNNFHAFVCVNKTTLFDAAFCRDFYVAFIIININSHIFWGYLDSHIRRWKYLPTSAHISRLDFCVRDILMTRWAEIVFFCISNYFLSCKNCNFLFYVRERELQIAIKIRNESEKGENQHKFYLSLYCYHIIFYFYYHCWF